MNSESFIWYFKLESDAVISFSFERTFLSISRILISRRFLRLWHRQVLITLFLLIEDVVDYEENNTYNSCRDWTFEYLCKRWNVLSQEIFLLKILFILVNLLEYLNSQVKTELILSSSVYQENECVFNVKGAYYFARKGN